MDGNSGFNEVNGTSGDDDLAGTSGNDALNGGLGSDTLDGGAGSDRFILADLDAVDTLNFQSSDTQQDIIDVSALLPDGQVNADNMQQFVKINSSGVFIDSSGAGEFSEENRVARFDSSSSVNSNLVSVQIAASTVVEFDWMATGDIPLINVAQYTDESNPDLVRGTYQADTLDGNAENNILAGGAGDDVLNGGEGADTYHGGAGNDTYVLSNTGDVETLSFKSTTYEKDVLDISAFLPAEATEANLSNYLQITADGVYLDVTGSGTFDDDVKIAEFTEDSIFTKDLIQVKIAGDTTVSFSVDPLIGVQPGDSSTFVNQAVARSMIDKLTEDGAQSFDSARNTAGFIRSDAGQKLDIDLSDNNITVAHGGAGDEILDATNISVTGNSEDASKLYGRGGNDTLAANADDNYLDGGLGNDRVVAGEGKNLLIGGEGRDEFQLTLETQADDEVKSDMLYDFTSQEGNRDILDLSLVLPAEASEANIHQYVQITEAGVYIDVSGGGNFQKTNELARFGENADIDNLVDIRLNDNSLIQMNIQDSADTVNGTAGDDYLQAGSGSQTLSGGDGDDKLDGDKLTRTESADSLYGGKGNDRLYVDDLDISEGVVDGGEGVDTLMMKSYDNDAVSVDMAALNVESAFTGGGNDTIDASGFTAAAGRYDASTGDFVAGEAQRAQLFGRGGNDQMTGGEANDYLDGGSGNDVLHGGADGRDILVGGAGNDTYVLANDSHVDKFLGFKATTSESDALDISAFVPADFTADQLSDYLAITNKGVYFDASGEGEFSEDGIIANLGWGTDLQESVRVIFNGTEVSLDHSTLLLQNISDTLDEDQVRVFTKEDFLESVLGYEGDSLTVESVSVDGSFGTIVDNGDDTYTFTPVTHLGGVDAVINFSLSNGSETVSSSVNLALVADADAPTVSISAFDVSDSETVVSDVLHLEEDGTFQMNISAGLADTDGSETLSVFLEGNPVGTVVSDGVNSFTVSEEAPSIDISSWNLAQIQVTPAADYYGWFRPSVRAVASEAGGDTKETVSHLQLRVAAVNDAPETEDNRLVMNEETAYQFSRDDFSFSDVDRGANFASIAVDTIPDAGELTLDGVAVNAGQQISASELENLKYTASALDEDTEVNFSFTVSDGMHRSEAKTFTLDLRDADGSSNISGSDDAEILIGSDQADLIAGAGGDDIIINTGGDDYITGGDGSDTFVWKASDHVGEDSDTISDFHTGSGGDIIDLSDVLSTSADSLDSLLNLSFDGGDTTIEMSPDADGNVTQKITLEGVDLQGYGGGASNTEILNNLIDDGNLMV